MRSIFVTAGLAVVAVSCTMNSTPTAASSPSAIPSSAPALDTPPPMPATMAPTPTATPPATPFVPFTVTTWADNVFLRSNPGYLFPQLEVLRKGASLLVLGKSPGAEWLLCQTSDNRVGWVFAQLVEPSATDLTQAPLIWPSSAQALVGRVKDQAGVPISGIQFSVVQGSGVDAPRNDAVTDNTGTFYAFMPPGTDGTWLVSYTAVSSKSNTMDANGNCRSGVCGSPDPGSISVVFPRSADDLLSFTWR